ncbi:hypothetical protein AAE478_000835 [Parahypoxylon ruwenzoriense]
MRSAGEMERLASAARFEKKLQHPENQPNALRLLQALIVKEIYGAKKQMGLIEAGFCKIQEANAAEGRRNENVERQLEELRGDKEGFRLLISEAEAATQNTKDDLETLREQVGDEYVKLTADNVKFSKDVKILSKQINNYRDQVGIIEGTLEDFRSKLLSSQEELVKLSATLARLESMVKSTYENVGQKKEVIAETINDHAQVRQFLDAFIPRQDKFSQFLEKLPERLSTFPSESAQTESMTEDNVSPQPDSASPETQPPPEARRMLEQYNHFSSSYRAKRPKSEARFIRSYLKKIDRRASWLVQKKLQLEHPDLVDLLERAETSNKTDVVIFINVDKLCWNHVKVAMHRIDGKELFPLLKSEQDKLDLSIPRKRPRMAAV